MKKSPSRGLNGKNDGTIKNARYAQTIESGNGLAFSYLCYFARFRNNNYMLSRALSALYAINDVRKITGAAFARNYAPHLR